MCGIVGYVGNREALPVILKGLHRLEYRGYDSAGVAIIGDDKQFARTRAIGKVNALEDALGENKLEGKIGLAHTRWATHGGVTERNAHPHICKNRISRNHDSGCWHRRRFSTYLGTPTHDL